MGLLFAFKQCDYFLYRNPSSLQRRRDTGQWHVIIKKGCNMSKCVVV